jgi:hypothetical protein
VTSAGAGRLRCRTVSQRLGVAAPDCCCGTDVANLGGPKQKLERRPSREHSPFSGPRVCGDQRRLVVVHAFCRACVNTVSIVSMIEMVSSSGINELSTSPASSRRATSLA